MREKLSRRDPRVPAARVQVLCRLIHMDRFARLRDHLLNQSKRCVRPPSGRFKHPWLAPMPPGAGAAAPPPTGKPAHAGSTDIFNTGDYSPGLFHHDAAESAIELLRHEEFVEPCRGSLLNFLDTMEPSGLVHRVETPQRTNNADPSKPVVAQFALRCAQASPDREQAASWLRANDVYERVVRFLRWTESNLTGSHGLTLAHSALQTGFDNDLLLVNAPERSIEDPGASAMMALEYDAGADLAALLGLASDSADFRSRAARVRALMNEHMWHDERAAGAGFYAALRSANAPARDCLVLDPSSGSDHIPTSPMLSWTSLLPLYARVPDELRAEQLTRLLTDPARFLGPRGVRTAPADSLYFNQSPRSLIYDTSVSARTAVSNWQGPVWVLSNYYLAAGLANYGHKTAARGLALATANLLADSLDHEGTLFECYNDAGEGLWPHSGNFVSWNVLAITMLDRFAAP
ncbi:MAG TPA: hypothetical protein VG797_08975 [Phycisphaerales bacterium]|nr:hypothetical protein [Phycisphaerales bacterium]